MSFSIDIYPTFTEWVFASLFAVILICQVFDQLSDTRSSVLGTLYQCMNGILEVILAQLCEKMEFPITGINSLENYQLLTTDPQKSVEGIT